MNKILLPERQEATRPEWTTHEQGSSRQLPQIGLMDLLMVLMRRRLLLIGTVVLVTALGVFAMQGMTPLYTAQTRVMVDPREQNVVNVEALVTGLTGDDASLESEIQVIRSEELARRVIRQLGLDRTAEFNPRIYAEENPRPWWRPNWRNWGPIQWLRAQFSEEPPPPDPVSEARILETRIVGNFLSRLSVSTVGRSRALSISFTSENPERAAQVADAVASLYITQQLEAKFDARQKANQWLNERLVRLREQVETAERAVEQFRATHGVVEGRDSTLVNEQMTQLNTQLIVARSELSTSRAQLNAMESAVRSRGIRAVFDIDASPLVANLRAQEAQLRQREAELLNNLGPRHPTIVDLNAQISSISGQINAEASNRLNAMRNQTAVAQQRVSSLEEAMAQLQQEAANINQTEVDMRGLQREAEANRALFETFLQRSKETSQVDIDQPNAWIISSASLPLRPSEPNKPLLGVMTLALAFGLALVLVFLAEQLESGLNTQEEVERYLHARPLGMIPLVRRGRLSRVAPQDYAIDRPASAYTQAIKSLFTSLIMAHQRRGGGNIILLTSAVPGEGKSAVAASLARVIATAGRKVLIIDCDLRRPNIHASLSIPNERGLADLLTGSAGLPDVLRHDSRTGAEVITAGKHVDHPEEIIRNPLFDQLLFNLGPKYDLVLLDAPPVLPVSDTRILADKASQCVVVAHWRKTKRRLVELALRHLNDAGGNVVGVALNQVDPAKASRYGSEEVDYYLGKRGAYFKN